MDTLQNIIIQRLPLQEIIKHNLILSSRLCYQNVDRLKGRFTLDSVYHFNLSIPISYLALAIGNSNLDKWLWSYLDTGSTNWDKVKYLSPIRRPLLNVYISQTGKKPQVDDAILRLINDITLFFTNHGLLFNYNAFSAIWERRDDQYSLILIVNDSELEWTASRLNSRTIDDVLFRLLQQCIEEDVMVPLYSPVNPIQLDQSRYNQLKQLSEQYPPRISLWPRLEYDYVTVTDLADFMPEELNIANIVFVVNSNILVVVGYSGAKTYNEEDGHLLVKLLAGWDNDYFIYSWEESAQDISKYLSWQDNGRFEFLQGGKLIQGQLNELPIVMFNH